MQPGAHLSYEQEDSAAPKWILIFILLSLLAHAVVIAIILLLSHFVPAPKLEAPPVKPPSTTMSLIPPPAAQKPKHVFMPTQAQDNAPHKDTLIESDHDTQVASHSKKSRDNNSVMPDVVSEKKHSADLINSPNIQAKPTPQNSTTPPTPKQQDQPKAETHPPQTQTAQTPQPNPAKPTPQPPKPAPPAPQVPKPVPQQVDPDGLPVLPPINAPTLQPQASPSAARAAQVAAPSPVLPAVASDISGRAGISGAPSPEAMATEIGKYKARFYAAVGSYWYPQVNNQLSLLGVGVVTIQYTIHYDGTITTKVLSGGDGSLMLLQTISVTSIRKCSPFLPFPPAMRAQVGDDYTDTFSFSIYGG